MTMRLLLCLTLLAMHQLGAFSSAGLAWADELQATARGALTGGERDGETVAQCADRLRQCLEALQSMRQGGRRHAEYLLPREHDVLERILTDYLRQRHELRQIAQRQKSHDAQLRKISLHCCAHHDLKLALLATEDRVLWRALNQSFYRSNIARGSCDRILHEVCLLRPESLPPDDQRRLLSVIQRQGVLIPSVENEVRHSQPVTALFSAGTTIATPVQQCQHQLMAVTARIKNPVMRPLRFSDQQRQEIHAALLPGDIMLNYAAGYTSNLFIPGYFKHASTYVGTDVERRQMGLAPEVLLASASTSTRPLSKSLVQTATETGREANVVESVSEGVRFINFDHYLATRVNRLMVIRPRLGPPEKAQQVADILSYVGDEFDFNFDLTEASEQVCTEVVYRSLQDRGGIDLPLTKHAGRLTLTVDELLGYALRTSGVQFDFILAVDESPQAPGTARVHWSEDSQKWAKKLLGGG